MYTNTKFNERVDNLTDLFCTLPPPKPTGINYSNDVRQPRLNMRNIMDADAGCILGNAKSIIKSFKNSKIFIKSIKNIKVVAILSWPMVNLNN